MDKKKCWVIEGDLLERTKWVLFTAASRPIWMLDPTKATRFYGRIDAEKMLKFMGFMFDVKVVEITVEEDEP